MTPQSFILDDSPTAAAVHAAQQRLAAASNLNNYQSNTNRAIVRLDNLESHLAPRSEQPRIGSLSWGGGDTWTSNARPKEKGVTGLRNLGNTCFMNSALQCLSNTPDLTQHFLSGRYKPEINYHNPLGMKGQVAEAFASTLRDMWAGVAPYIAPYELKQILGTYAPQFSGYSQHDAQELLGFLLDGLHEDLNRVLDKPYVEIKDSEESREAIAVAIEAWENHRRRNDSVIVDLFQGQYKSKVVCPDCGKVSITFDPFMYLSLPIPVKDERLVKVVLIRSDGSAMKYGLRVPKPSTVRDLRRKLSELSNVPVEHLHFTDVDKCRFHALSFDDSTSISKIQLDAQLFAHEVLVRIPRHRETPRHIGTPPSPVVTELQPFSSTTLPTSQVNDTHMTTTSTPSSPTSTPTHPTVLTPTLPLTTTDTDMVKDRVEVVKPSESESEVESEVESETDQSENETPEELVFVPVIQRLRCLPRFLTGPPVIEYINYPFIITVPKQATWDDVNREIWLRMRRFLDGFEQQWEPPQPLPYTLRLCTPPQSYDFLPGYTVRLERNFFFSADWIPDVWDAKGDDEKDIELHPTVTKKYGLMLQHQQASTPITLQHCLQLWATEERLSPRDPWRCSRCQDFKEASKKLDLWKLPKLLVVHLKRFTYERGFSLSRDKIDALVDYPLKGLDLTPFAAGPQEEPPIYDLYAVSQHMGGMGGGHYTAVCKNVTTGKWISFDDTTTTEVDEESVRADKHAYVLFYKRRDASSHAPSTEVTTTTTHSTSTSDSVDSIPTDAADSTPTDE